MKPSEFCYWLQGYFEISGNKGLTQDQGVVVQNHLALVFKHELDAPDPDGSLQDTHDGVQSATNPFPSHPVTADSSHQAEENEGNKIQVLSAFVQNFIFKKMGNKKNRG